jgi:bacillithiol biosynthesis cysteine-adding enzyme BshC
MSSSVQYIPYSKTGYFNQLVIDFLGEHPNIRPFYSYSPLQPDFEAAIKAKQQHPINRELLVSALQEQYAALELDPALQENINSLIHPTTFTVTTAHQPNIFTGYLYFVYKILQTVKLAAQLKQQYPAYNFVPVYYMGSEDNDLDELGSIFLDGKTITWNTNQEGAVGRMRPEGFDTLIEQVQYGIGYGEHAEELISLLKQAYLEQPNIQDATLFLVNKLFGKYGLVVLVPDNPAFKKQFIPVMEEELWHHTSQGIVSKTIAAISQHYKVQANPREINLFYLAEGIRQRIVKEGEKWEVLNTNLSFTAAELKKELHEHPERFSPNVILRGLFQETILPNLAFIGGGGEIAYWLELKQLFVHHQVPFPVLLLRNSFLFVDAGSNERLEKLGLSVTSLFGDTETLVNNFVQEHTNAALCLKDEYSAIEKLFDELEAKARSIDITLVASTASERKKAVKSVGKLEHKFLKAEKKKFAWQTEQIWQLKNHLFPANSLQERKENFMPWYAKEGPAFFDKILAAATPVTDQFCIVVEGVNGAKNV